MVFDVAPPFLSKRLRKPFFFGIRTVSNRGPHRFPRCFCSAGLSTVLVGWENLQKTQKTSIFHGKIHVSAQDFRTSNNHLISREQFPSQHPMSSDVVFFFKGDSGDSWPPLDAGGTAPTCVNLLREVTSLSNCTFHAESFESEAFDNV